MYEFISQIGNFLSQPFLNIVSGTKGIPILFAFLLGIIGAMAPCQFTGNLGAITVYGNKSLQNRTAWTEMIFFILGKIVVFSLLGMIVWIFGSEVKSSISLFFPWFRKIVGPILILIGLFMFGIFKIYKSFSLGSLSERWKEKGNLGAFLMGVSFTLGFCPTMFVLFFITLMPLSLSVPFGIVLPVIFALGTSFPLILAIFLISYFGLSGKIMKKKGRRIGSIVQRVAGIFMIVLGILDTITYWSL